MLCESLLLLARTIVDIHDDEDDGSSSGGVQYARSIKIRGPVDIDPGWSMKEFMRDQKRHGAVVESNLSRMVNSLTSLRWVAEEVADQPGMRRFIVRWSVTIAAIMMSILATLIVMAAYLLLALP